MKQQVTQHALPVSEVRQADARSTSSAAERKTQFYLLKTPTHILTYLPNMALNSLKHLQAYPSKFDEKLAE